MALIDYFALNINKITGFWNFGLFWPSLAFIGLYDLFWPLMVFKAKIGVPMSESNAIDVLSIPKH